VEKAKILNATMDRMRNRLDQLRESLAMSEIQPDLSI
jgi:hypothetical protein